MPRFRLAKPADLPRLTALWQEAFGDERAVIEDFWTRCFDQIQVFCLFEEAQLCAMACVLPLSYVDAAGESYACPYFYAVATAKAWRGRGLCRSLLARAEEFLQNQGAKLCCLVPQGAELFRFYEKLGYRTAFALAERRLPAQKAAAAKAKKLHAAAYETYRQIRLYGEFIAYPDFLLQLQQAAGEASGAGLYRLERGDTLCVAAAEKHGETLLLKEMLPADETLASHLAALLGCREALLRSPAPGEEAKPFAMAKALDAAFPLPEMAYLALAFD